MPSGATLQYFDHPLISVISRLLRVKLRYLIREFLFLHSLYYEVMFLLSLQKNKPHWN